MADKVWIIEATDHEGNRLIVRSEREDTAEHLRALFKAQDYSEILVFRPDSA